MLCGSRTIALEENCPTPDNCPLDNYPLDNCPRG